jgi:hypothetical protein
MRHRNNVNNVIETAYENVQGNTIYSRLCLRVKMLLLLNVPSFTLPLYFPKSLIYVY